MWMPEYGIVHNLLMAVGYLIGLVILGGLVCFAITIRPRDEFPPKK